MVRTQKQRNSGFSAVIIIVAIVIIALGGTAGWIIYQNNHNPKPVTAVVTHKPTPDPTASWTPFSSKLGKFSLRYPVNWIQPAPDANCQGALGDSVLFLSSEILPVTTCDSQMYIDANAGDKTAAETPTNDSGYANVITTAVTVDGIKGTRSTATVAQGHPGHEYIPGSKIIQYVFFTNDMTYRLQYLQNPVGSKGFTQDVSHDFDLMVTKTLKFTKTTPTAQSTEPQTQVLNCLKNASAKPTDIVLACADVNTVAENIVWSSWTPYAAVGSGDIKANDCKPDCADGHLHTYPAKFSLNGVKKVGQINYFTALQVQYTGSYPGQGATEKYSLSTP